jgi:hypothetical protein
LGEYADTPVSLALVLSAALVGASADLRRAPAGELHDRFLGWLPQHAPSGHHAAQPSAPIPT